MSIWRGSRIRNNRYEEEEGGVVAAAQRLLGGGAVGLFREAGYPSAPSWAYLNRLAHSPYQALVGLAQGTEGARPGGWSFTSSYIAAELLTFEKSEAQVVRTQREVLVPLELDILGGQVAEPANPPAFVSLVMGALEQHRTWRPW